MTNLAHIKLFEAEHYVEDAIGRLQSKDEYSPSVAATHATQAVILAIDALCHRCNVPTARRHDEGPRVFLELIRSGTIPEDASQWRELIAGAISQRARYQYHGELMSRRDAARFVGQVEKFVGYVRRIVN